jgi:glycosyltransferase involved in cell wall biosynthesis
MMQLSILIPVYNERETICKLLHRVQSAELDGVRKGLVVVDDSSTDGTREILQEVAQPPDVFVYLHQHN